MLSTPRKKLLWVTESPCSSDVVGQFVPLMLSEGCVMRGLEIIAATSGRRGVLAVMMSPRLLAVVRAFTKGMEKVQLSVMCSSM